MSRRTLLPLLALVVITCIAADRATKVLAEESLRGRPPIELAGGFLTLLYVENAGAMLSFGASLSPLARFLILTVGVGILLAAMTLYLIKAKNPGMAQVIAVALMLGGGTSNLLDRLVREGKVVDFMNVGIGPVRTGVFNVADLAITAGVAAFLVAAMRRPKAP